MSARACVLATSLAVCVTACAERTVSTLAGGTEPAARIGEQDGLGEEARFRDPRCIALADDGTLYVSDMLRIRLVTPDGEVSTLAGGGNATGFVDGIGEEARFFSVPCVALGQPDELLVADGGNAAIRRVRISTREVTTIAGGTRGYADGTFEEARFGSPFNLAYDRERRMAFVYDDGRLRVLDFDAGTVRTLAGSGFRGSEDGTAAEASFWAAAGGLVLDGEGGLLVADTFNRTIRRVSAEGVVTTIAGMVGVDEYAEGQGSGALFRAPAGLAVGEGRFYVTDAVASVVREIRLDGSTSWIAGRPVISGMGVLEGNDGSAKEATFRMPGGIAAAPDGRIYVLEQFRVRVIE